MSEDFRIYFTLIAVIVVITITVLMIIAVLKLPKIARYNLAQLKLTALMAKEAGVKPDTIEGVIKEADENIRMDRDLYQMEYKAAN